VRFLVAPVRIYFESGTSFTVLDPCGGRAAGPPLAERIVAEAGKRDWSARVEDIRECRRRRLAGGASRFQGGFDPPRAMPHVDPAVREG